MQFVHSNIFAKNVRYDAPEMRICGNIYFAIKYLEVEL